MSLDELLAAYWWVGLITVPALALLIKSVVERSTRARGD